MTRQAFGAAVVLGAVVFAAALGACQSFVPIDRGTFGPFVRSLNTTSHGYRVIPDPTGGAPTAMVERFEVRPGDCGSEADWSDCATDRERSELSERGGRNPAGSSHWYGWSIFVPRDCVNVFPTKVALGQFHQEKSHVIWMFQNGAGGYHLDDQTSGHTTAYHGLLDDESWRGRWHRIEVHAKWSLDDSGFFTVWVDGERKVDFTGRTMSAQTVYFKYGIYRSFLSRHTRARGVSEVPAQVVYFANVRRADTREGLAPPPLPTTATPAASRGSEPAG